MKNKLGIFTALILSLMIAGSAFAMPKTVSTKKAAAAKANVSKTTTKKKKKHRRARKAVKKTTPAPTKK